MRRTTVCGALFGVGLGITTLLTLSGTRAQERAANRKVFANSVIELPEKPGPAPHGLMVAAAVLDHSNDKMDLLFSFAIPKEARAKLEARVLKGEVVDPKELAQDYSPKPDDVERLEKWLKDQGFEVTGKVTGNTGVYARGTVGQIAKSLQVQMIRVSKNGQTYNAARNAPSLPADVGTGVQSVIGLQPFRQFTKKSRKYRHVGPPAPSANIGNAPPYLVKEVLKAYNANGLDVTGAGQTIAILIDTQPLQADTEFFWKKNGVPVVAGRVETINVNNATLPPLEGEESLDVQWSSGIASGAKVRVYATGSLAFVDLDKGLDRILGDAMSDPSLRQVSISLGLGEQFLSPGGTLDGEMAIEEDFFLRMAALGVNVFVSSGDAGSNPDNTGHGRGPDEMPEWMASSPFVVSVGGTELHLAGGGGVASELGWIDSGGGVSKVFDKPSYQNMIASTVGVKRLVPDVSLIASPNTGVYVRVNGQDEQIGGTSASAPVWAGFCALLNEARTKANKPALSFLNPQLYPLLGTNCFRDITVGSNGAFSAGPGYDLVTGIGVPHVRNLADKLKQ